ncbi:MAG: proline dehydrogenase family protein [Nitrososphaerales archaeon]
MTGFPLRLARQWIAGETINDGVARAREANSKGFLGLLNLLGEEIKSREEIKTTLLEYSNLLARIEESRVKSQISVKPTQLGLTLNYDDCLQNYLVITELCRSHSENWLWVDMENSPYTEKTIELYKYVLSKYPNTGIAIQAYLRRSETDLRDLLAAGAKVRLVKGAYNESPEIAFKNKREVSENYAKLMKMLFEQSEKNLFAIATHDGRLVEQGKELSKKNNSHFEFEMLMGVRDKLKADLVLQKYQVREYIPYGPEWFAYSMRRLREKKSNIFLLARSLFSS